MFSKNYTDTVGCGSWISSSLIYNNNSFYINGGDLVLREDCDSYWSRGLCFLKIDSVGNLKKTTYLTDCDKVIYEGNFSSLVINNNVLFSCGHSYEYDEDTSSCFLLSLDTNLDTISFVDFIKDTTTKRALSLAVTLDNNLIMCGGIDSTYNEMLRIPDTTYSKACLFKLTLAGEILWQKSYSFEDESDGCYSLFKKVITAKDGGFIAIGYFDIDHTIKNVIVKTDSLGNQEWVRVHESSAYDSPTFTDVIETKDSSYVVCGAYAYGEEYGGFYPYDAWILKYDKYGSLQWSKKHRDSITSGSSSNDYFGLYEGVLELNNGDITAICRTYCDENGEFIGQGLRLRMLDSIGNRKWDKVFTTAGDDGGTFYANSIILTDDNNIAIGGWGEFYYYDSLGDWTFDQRIFLINTDISHIDTSTNNIIQYNPKPIKDFALNCYPNPASNETYIDIPSDIREDVLLVYSTNGTTVHEQTVYLGENRINLCNLKTGMYLLRLKNSGLYGKLVVK